MKNKLYIFFTLLLLLIGHSSYAIDPSKEYIYTPESFGLQYNEESVITEDGYRINIWHIPCIENNKTPILISYGDSGNMGNWMGVAATLHYLGYEVWMFDYRGFGSSDDFNADRDVLFCMEYYADLKSVITHIASLRQKINLLSFSMGTILVSLYLSEYPNSPIIRSCAFDGMIANPVAIISRLKLMGKDIALPSGFNTDINLSNVNIPMLIIQSRYDDICKIDDLHLNNSTATIKTFECGHNEAAFLFPEDFFSAINNFYEKYEEN